MKIASHNWKDVEDYLKKDNKCIIPIGSTEQHAYLSLATDSILAEKISVDAAEPLGVPVFPVIPFGHTPMFMDYPGTISLTLETLNSVITEVLDSVYHQGFRKILIVNGHGGNMPMEAHIKQWSNGKKDSQVKFHNWWRTSKTWAKVVEIDSVASHASWVENFEWTRIPGVIPPHEKKPMIDLEKLRDISPEEARKLLGDGNWGGLYQRSDDEMNMIWTTAVEETRDLINYDWE